MYSFTLKNLYDEFHGIKTTNEAVRCLEIFIGHDKVECYNKKWMKLILKSFLNLRKEEN